MSSALFGCGKRYGSLKSQVAIHAISLFVAAEYESHHVQHFKNGLHGAPAAGFQVRAGPLADGERRERDLQADGDREGDVLQAEHDQAAPAHALRPHRRRRECRHLHRQQVPQNAQESF